MNFKKSISLVLTLCMVFSLFATFVFPVAAEDAPTYKLIDAVEGLTTGTYYMSGVVDTTYHVFTGSIGNGDLYTSAYTYTDGALSTEESYLAVAVEVTAVEGKVNTYTLYVADKGYITCTDATNNRRLAFSDTAAEWVASANDNGGINLAITVDGATAYMGTNDSDSSKFIRQYKEASYTAALSYGLVFFAEVVAEEPEVTSNVVTYWNVSDWSVTALGADGAHIFTDADAYATATHEWWFHAAFAPTDVEGVYEVTSTRSPTFYTTQPRLEIPEGGFVWVAHDTAAAGTAGAYSVAVITSVAVGDKVTFTGLDIANQTTTADATAVKYVAPAPSIDFEWVDAWKEVDENGVWQVEAVVPADELFDYDYAIEKEGENVNIGIKYRGSLSGSAASFGNGNGTNFRIWFFNPVSDKGWDHLMDVSYNGSEWVVECRSNGANPYEYPYGTENTPFTVTVVETADGAEAEVVLPISVLGYESSYFKVLVSASNKEVSNYCLHCDNHKSAPTTAERWEESGVVIGDVYKEGLTIEYDDTQVGLLGSADLAGFEAGLTDGNLAENATDWANASGVYPFTNLVCTNGTVHPEISFIFNQGEAKDVNTISIMYNAYPSVCIGVAEPDVDVYYSADGIEWTFAETVTTHSTVFAADAIIDADESEDVDTRLANTPVKAVGTLSETVNAQYVKFVLTYPDFPEGYVNADGKVVWEFIGLTEIGVSYVEPDDESYKEVCTYVDGVNVGTIQGEAIDPIATFWRYIEETDEQILVIAYFDDRTVSDTTILRVWVDTDLSDTARTTLFDIKVADGVAYVQRVDAGFDAAVVEYAYETQGKDYAIALVLDKAALGISGAYGLCVTVMEDGYSTVHDVEYDNTNANAPWTTTAYYNVYGIKLNEVNGGDLPEHNPRLGALNVPAYTAITYTVAFENGANFNLWDENVTVLVNGEALEMGEFGYVAVLEKGDVVTIVNATAEAVDLYPSISAIIPGTSSNPIVLEELGDITADVTENHAMEGGVVFYNYTAPANGTLTLTMPESGWTYTVNNVTANSYGDQQWSDSDPVINPYVIEVSEGDLIQIIVGKYNPDDPWDTVGEVTFNVAFEEAAVTSQVVENWNVDDWNNGINTSNAAYIFTDAEVYASTDAFSWWRHVAFAPTGVVGVYEVTGITVGTSGESGGLTIPEGGFVWAAFEWPGEGGSGAYSLGVMSTLAVGDRVYFDGVNISAATTEADATATKIVTAADLELLVSHNYNYNWHAFEGQFITGTIADADGNYLTVAGDAPNMAGQVADSDILYIVENVGGAYLVTGAVSGKDAILATAIPENGFLYYITSNCTNYSAVCHGELVGCYLIIGDIDLNTSFAIDTQQGNPAYVVKAVTGFKVGDVNMNGKIDATDYATIRKLVIGAADPADFSELALELADVNGNGKIDANDYILVKRHFLETYTIPAWAEEE